MDQGPWSRFDKKIDDLIKSIENWSPWDVPDKPKSDWKSSKQLDTSLMETGRWLNIIRHPSIVLILGARGGWQVGFGL